MPELLLEIGTEEIPAGYIGPALEALEKNAWKLLSAAGFDGEEADDSGCETTGTPRRLVFHAWNLSARSAETEEKVKGPPADRAFDEDEKPTKAAEGFAKKHGVKVSELEVHKDLVLLTQETGDGTHVGVGATAKEYVYATVKRGGEKLSEFLKQKLPGAISALPFPKSMRWLSGEKTSFARPVRYLLCLLDKKVIPFEFAGLVAGRESRGHPFHAPEKFTLREARYGVYKAALKGRKVLLDLEDRRERVRRCVEKGAEKAGGRPYNKKDVADALIDEVTNLIEWPGAVIGSFDEEICSELPDEVIVAAQTRHQRYFPVEDSSGRLLPRFVAIANRDPSSGGKAKIIRSGNERVLRARLADALFFWREDKKKRLEERLPALDDVVFHEKLGSMRQKAERMAELAEWLAVQSGQEPAVGQAAARAALLAKCDLVTHMVFEFPELQGVMGKQYAREDGEPSSVRQAIEEHYLPRSAEESLPRSQVGRLTALADKLDSITGGFAAGLAPTGSKDPYALRRAALGVIAIIRKAKLFTKGPGLRAIVEKCESLYRDQGMLKDAPRDLADKILDFVRDRLEVVMGGKGRKVELLRAALAAGVDNLADLEARLKAVTEFSKREDFAELCTVVERARNIVRKAPELAESRPEPQKNLLAEPEETELFEVYIGAGTKFRMLVSENQYLEASELYLKSFAAPLHKFFEKVFVNVEDAELRTNRLALLAEIYRLYATSVADLAECAGEAKA